MPAKKKLFRKSTLRVGQKLKSPTADSPIEITKDRLHTWVGNFARLRHRETPTPVSFTSRFDHPTDHSESQPIPRDDENKFLSAANAAGFLRDFTLGEDGESAQLTMEIHGAKAIEKCDDNSVFASPVIVDRYTDGEGETFAGEMPIAAELVHLPVDRKQGPFVPVETA